ncbi:hypothetical protein Ciccas_014116 [Cichlidogyrus casuarinus]|uniref:Uncharacterized protein n=1 Tax=Cichlidogyrus casuarinus TaxID=1844966 RepID=A0ABD2PJM7_9PLAT
MQGAILNFGKKSTEPESLCFNELFYELDVNDGRNNGVLDPEVDSLNLVIEALEKNGTKKLTAPPYYFPGSRGYHDTEIPGHTFTHDDRYRKFRAEYYFNAEKTELASATLTKAVKFAG